MSRFLAQRYRAFDAYTPGEQPRDKSYIKLNTNEFPYPPAPDVLVATGAEAVSDLRLYCDPTAKAFKEALGKHYSVEPDEVFVSNGSDESLNFAFATLFERGVAFADITYGFYSVFAKLYGIDTRIVPLLEDFSINADDYIGIPECVVIANPNAPTGKALPLCEIERIVASDRERVVVVDEAYVDFGSESAVVLTKKYDNLLVCGTFSKSRGLAGARIGYAIGNRELIADLEFMKYSTNPYNLDALAQRIGVAALSESSVAYYKDRVGEVIKAREWTQMKLSEMGADFIPSSTNFIFVKLPGIDGAEAYTTLRERGILVRYFRSPRILDYFRVSIGTKEDMEAFVTAVSEMLKEKNNG